MDNKDDLKLIMVGKEAPKGFEVVETGDKIDLSDETIDALALEAIKDGTIRLVRKVQGDGGQKGESFCGVGKKEALEGKPTSNALRGGIKFEKVGLDHSGRMATVGEVRANFDDARRLLAKWTIALLDGGKLCGTGYGSTVEEGDFSHQIPPQGNIIGEKIIVVGNQSPKVATGESLCEEETKEAVEANITSSEIPDPIGEAMAEMAAKIEDPLEQLDEIHKEFEKLTEEPRKQYEEQLKKQGGVAHYKTITKDADGDFKVPEGWSLMPMMQLVNYMGDKDPGDNPELSTFLKHIFTSGAGQGFPESKTIITDKKVVMKIDGKEVRKVERSEDRTFNIEEGWVEVPKSDETVQKMIDLVSTKRELELFQTGQLAFVTKKEDGEPDYKAIRSDEQGKFEIPDGWSIVGMMDPAMEMLMPRYMTGPQDVDDFNSGKMVIITNKPGAGPKEDWVLVEKKDGEFIAPEGFEIKDVNEANIGEYMDRIQHLLNKTVIEKFNDGLVKFALKSKDEPKKEANLGDFIGAMGGLMAAFAPGEEGQQIQKEVNQMASMFGASPGTMKKDDSKKEPDLGDVMGAMGGLMAAFAPPQEKPKKKPKKILTMPATVSFIFRPKQEATLVEISGSFNDWSPAAMAKEGGHWRISLRMKPGQHQYKYIVDGQWQHDEDLHSCDDQHGGCNNVINVDYEDVEYDEDKAEVSAFGDGLHHQKNSLGTFTRSTEYQGDSTKRFATYKMEKDDNVQLLIVMKNAWRISPVEISESGGVGFIGEALKHSSNVDLEDPNELPPTNGWMFCRETGGEFVNDDTIEVLTKGVGKSNIMFVETSGGSIPPNTFPAGKDENGETLYVGRAKHGRSLVPGKFQPSSGCVYVSYGGEEHAYNTTCEVLVQEGNVDNLRWINAGSFQDAIWTHASEFPIGGVMCGYEEDMSPLFVARAKIGEQQIIGKVGGKEYCKCWIPFNGTEREVEGRNAFEVLCCTGLAVQEYNSEQVLSTKKSASAEEDQDEDDSAGAENNDGNTVQCAQQ